MEPKHLKHIIIKSEQERERMKQEQDALWEALDVFDIVKENFPEVLHERLAQVEQDAIIDALLGSCSLGDIGKHFPDIDKKYKGISSLIMLRKTYKILKKNKVYISHIDCTLVGETPKISKYTNKMSLKIANTLELIKENVSIKATTTEGLGFTGRQEGISCYCVATIKQES